MKNKIILITHQKGGVGKSTLAYNLANVISSNSKVAILDFDLQGSLTQLKDMVSNFDIIPFDGEIEEVKKLDYDFILIDTPPYLSNRLSELIGLAKLIIIPTKAGILDLLAIKGTIELINNERKAENALIVFNMVKANTTLTLDILIGIDEYKIPVAKTHISDLVAFTRSVLIGELKDKNAKSQLENLAREVLTKLI